MSTLTVATKTCTRCGETKSLTEFYRNRNSPDGLRARELAHEVDG